jgi:hypothetical protein
MSKRHNTSRRRTYGRRQHELHERVDRRADRRADRAWRVTAEPGSATWDSHAAEAPFGFAD